MVLYIFYPFFSAVYIVKRLVLQTIDVLNKEILQLLGQNPCLIIKSMLRICILNERVAERNASNPHDLNFQVDDPS